VVGLSSKKPAVRARAPPHERARRKGQWDLRGGILKDFPRDGTRNGVNGLYFDACIPETVSQCPPDAASAGLVAENGSKEALARRAYCALDPGSSYLGGAASIVQKFFHVPTNVFLKSFLGWKVGCDLRFVKQHVPFVQGDIESSRSVGGSANV